MSSPENTEHTLRRIMEERRAKAEQLRAAGRNPYRNDFAPSTALAALRRTYEGTKPAEPPPGIQPIDDQIHRVAGRVMAKRGFGKTVFAPLRDGSGELQLYLNVDHLDAADFEQVLPLVDAGDVVGAEGPIFWTKRGELSLLARRLVIITKSLRPLPDKWHGLTDVELRYRQRWLDLAVNPEVGEVMRKRTHIIRGLRQFLDARGFLEVETPMMHPIIGGAAARPFVTHHNTLDTKLYMRIAPELYLKRLLVGGFERVYEINRNFRNEGVDRYHNPEFTMLEFYQAYATYADLMDLTEEMIATLAQQVCGTTTLTWEGAQIDLARPWKRISVRDAVIELGGQSPAVFDDPALAADAAARAGVDAKDIKVVLAGGAEPRVQAGHLGYLIFDKLVEHQLVQPTFVTDFPLAVSPLARKKEADPVYCDRFELFINGRELANAFSELNDPDDQRSRFQAQVRAKESGAAETMDYDEDYCRALELGMPSAAGEGVGIDRLTMLLTNQESIRDVILFPLMRPE
ncbi:MAG TPA: lysine--tRNA ligase [Kofleriaceae bacterium]|nr:lysine--tRNA ligase [Kofleriaceae bacterium]